MQFQLKFVIELLNLFYFGGILTDPNIVLICELTICTSLTVIVVQDYYTLLDNMTYLYNLLIYVVT
jgi:hypothetical protein